MTTLPGHDPKTAVHPEMTVADKPIGDWTEVFRQIYEGVDSSRSPVEMWVAAAAHFSKVGEAIRMDFAELMKYAAHGFCWMCSFLLACQRVKGTVFTLDESFSDIVACKYPLVCGHCREKRCYCRPLEQDEKPDKAARYRDLLKIRATLAPEKFSLSTWLTGFNDIYGQQIHMLTLESIGFHFLEEAGEELTAIRNLLQLASVDKVPTAQVDKALLEKLATFPGALELYDQYRKPKHDMKSRDAADIIFRLAHAKIDMFVEFADTFSWFCSILNKVKSIAENCEDGKCRFTEQAFQQSIIREYLPDGKPRCPSCEGFPCTCVFYN